MSESSPLTLSARERQTLKLAAAGLTDVAIAHRLGISEATVSTYWRRIRSKIGSHSRTELVATVLKLEIDRAVSALREEHDRREAANGAQSTFLQELLEHAPDPVLIVSSDGTIRLLNDLAAGLFGWPIDELAGQHLSVLLPIEHREVHRRHVGEFVASPAKRPMRDHLATPALHREGNVLAVDASLAPFEHEGETWVLCFIRSLHHRIFGSVVPQNKD